MAKPSMFSKNYDQQMKRRKLNVVLLVLILISMAFYGGRYYLKKNNIKLFDYKKFQVKNKVKEKDNVVKKEEKKVPPKVNDKNNNVTNAQNTQAQFYVYKRKDSKEVNINYTVNGTIKEITGITDVSNEVTYDISQDKQRIVFDDNSAGTIVMADANGTFSTISREEYVSKSSGDVYKKDNVIARNPWFIWATKPHFTTEGNVVYLSHLPYIKKNGNLYLWVVKPDGTGHKKVTKLNSDITKIIYGNFNENGNLEITSGDKTYFISKDGYNYSNE